MRYKAWTAIVVACAAVLPAPHAHAQEWLRWDERPLSSQRDPAKRAQARPEAPARPAPPPVVPLKALSERRPVPTRAMPTAPAPQAPAPASANAPAEADGRVSAISGPAALATDAARIATPSTPPAPAAPMAVVAQPIAPPARASRPATAPAPALSASVAAPAAQASLPIARQRLARDATRPPGTSGDDTAPVARPQMQAPDLAQAYTVEGTTLSVVSVLRHDAPNGQAPLRTGRAEPVRSDPLPKVVPETPQVARAQPLPSGETSGAEPVPPCVVPLHARAARRGGATGVVYASRDHVTGRCPQAGAIAPNGAPRAADPPRQRTRRRN